MAVVYNYFEPIPIPGPENRLQLTFTIEKKFTINKTYDLKTTTKYKVVLLLIIKRQQTSFAIMGFYAFLSTYTTQPSVTNFLCKDPPYRTDIFV